MSQFYDQVAAQIEGADSQSLSLIEAVNRSEGQRFYRPRGAIAPTNLDDILPSLQKSFARELSNRLVKWLPERATLEILENQLHQLTQQMQNLEAKVEQQIPPEPEALTSVPARELDPVLSRLSPLFEDF